MLRVEMLYEDNPHACVGWQILEQFRERLQPAGGSANANDGKMVWNPAFRLLGFRLEVAVRLLCLPGSRLGVETLRALRLSIRALYCRSLRRRNFLAIFRFHRTSLTLNQQ